MSARDERERGSIRQAELIATLSLAIDIGLGADMESSLRVCVASCNLASSLGMEGDDLALVYYLSLMRLAGCTSDSHEVAEIMGDELRFGREASTLGSPSPSEMMGFLWGFVGSDRSLPSRMGAYARVMSKLLALKHGAHAHCEVAALLSKRLGLGEDVTDAVWFFFERWDGKGRPKGRSGQDIPLPVRIVQLGQQIVALSDAYGREGALDALEAQAGKAFDPALVAHVAANPDLISSADSGSPWDETLALEPEPQRTIAPERLDDALATLGEFADLKSLYTAGNARAVATLAGEAAARSGLSENDVAIVRRAALVKDVGRAGVTAAIWDKRGELTRGEWEKVRLHPYLGERVMSRSPGLQAVGRIASMHHETLDGSGYHRAASASEIPFGARLLQAADRYHAMTSRRPWREAMSPDEAATELQGAAEREVLDPRAVAAVLEAAGRPVPRRRPQVAGLTERELEVLGALASGYTTKEIAARLHISRKTADHHIQNIYAKLDVSTRAAATVYAMQHGLVSQT